MFSDALTVLTKETISTNHCLQIVLMYKQKKVFPLFLPWKITMMCWTSKVSNYHVILVEKENLICLSPGIWSVFHRQTTASLFDSTSSRFMSAWLNQCWSSGENHIPQLCRKKHTHTRHLFQIPETVHRYIYFFEWKKKEKTVGFEMLGRRTVPARLRGHDGIYSVKFPTHCSHQSTHTQMPKHTSYSALDPPTLPGSELDRVAASWLSAGVKLQYLNKKYADWNVWNNTQLSRHFRQMEAFGDGALTASHPPTLQ